MRISTINRTGIGITAGITLLFLTGCMSGTPAKEQGGEKKNPSASATAPERSVADMKQPFPSLFWINSPEKGPLDFTRSIAHTAGGTWIALSPHPLDELTWAPNYNEAYRGGKLSAASVMEKVRKAGTTFYQQERSIQSGDGKDQPYQLLYFGPQEEADRLRAAPPTEIVGIYLAAPNGDMLLRSVSDLWHLKIEIPPDLCRRRDGLIAARHAETKEGQSPSYRGGNENQALLPAFEGPEFQLSERISPEELLHRLADYFGATCEAKGDTWQFKPITDPAAVKARLETLEKHFAGGGENISFGGFTSFSDRQSGADGQSGSESVDPASITIPDPDDVSKGILDDISIFGAEAVPTLSRLLDAKRPMLARGILAELGRMHLPESRGALMTFARSLETPPAGGSERVIAIRLYQETVQIMLREAESPEIGAYLATVARNSQTPVALRMSIREALAGNGNLTPLLETTPAASPSPTDISFTVGTEKDKTTADEKTEVVVPLATFKAPEGDTWAVFLSKKYGNPDDFWLGRGTAAGRWEEFLFTGESFRRRAEYREEFGEFGQAPKPGSCELAVSGDIITIRPPAGKDKDEMARLEKMMRDKTLPAVQRQSAAQKHYRLTQRRAGNLNGTVTLSLATLRADTDKDGLPDIVEERLGLDPKQADTDGDGVPDGTDLNPLVSRTTPQSDRSAILQLVFYAVFGGDPSPLPIIVVLEKEYYQEFQGSGTRVLCLTPTEFARQKDTMKAFRVLQFGGPQDADNTILNREGPCLFNDSKTRAEVYYWYWYTRPDMRMMLRSDLRTDQPATLPQDLLARFTKQGNRWTLIAAKPWRYDSAQQALSSILSTNRGIEF